MTSDKDFKKNELLFNLSSAGFIICHSLSIYIDLYNEYLFDFSIADFSHNTYSYQSFFLKQWKSLLGDWGDGTSGHPPHHHCRRLVEASPPSDDVGGRHCHESSGGGG